MKNSDFDAVQGDDEDSDSRVIDFKKRGEGFYQKIYGVWYDLPSIEKSKNNHEQRLVRRVNGIDELICEYSSRIASMRREKIRLQKQIKAHRKKQEKERDSKHPPRISFFNLKKNSDKKKSKSRRLSPKYLSSKYYNNDVITVSEEENHFDLTEKNENEDLDNEVISVSEEEEENHVDSTEKNEDVDMDNNTILDTKVLASENRSHRDPQHQEQLQQQRPVITQEALTPPHFQDNAVGSTSVLNVRLNPNVKSIQEYSHWEVSQGKKIGKGQKCVQLAYKSSTFSPVFVETIDEVQAIVALAKEKIKEREYLDKHGAKSFRITPTTEATCARSILPKDIVKYIDKAFTKKGLKENIIGRKRRNYPQRSKVIKEDPITKELILPNGERMINTSLVEKGLDQIQHLNNVPALPKSPSLLTEEKNLDIDYFPVSEEENHVDDDGLSIRLSEIHEPKIAANFYYNVAKESSATEKEDVSKVQIHAPYANNNLKNIVVERDTKI